MELARSKYNFFVERPQGVIAYNARTGVFALLSRAVADCLRSNDRLPGLKDEAELVEQGFVHFGDELAEIKALFEQQRSMPNHVHVTIVPTLACNYECPYCFQNECRSSRMMSQATKEAALRWIRHWITADRREVLITWFGGEPLLCKRIVLDTSRELRELAGTAGARLELTIVTNGILLDSTTAQDLAASGISSAQITIDCLVYDGCHTRGVVDSAGQPSQIIANACEARKYLRIGVRVNVSSDNRRDLPQIVKTLRAYGFSGELRLARVHDFRSEGYELIRDMQLRRTDQEGSRSIAQPPGATRQAPDLWGHGLDLPRDAYARVEKEVVLDSPDGLLVMIEKLRPKGQFCSATGKHMFVIDPVGNISRCWHSAGSQAEALGNVYDDARHAMLQDSAAAKGWKNYSPFRFGECVRCKVLPLCMGGCSHDRVWISGAKPPCESINQQIQYCVDRVAEHIAITEEQLALVS